MSTNQTPDSGEEQRHDARSGEAGALEALRASETRYRRLFESAQDGILILDAETGIVVDVNPFLLNLLGYTREAFLTKKVWELGFLKETIANEEMFRELQAKGYVRYEDLPLETSDGRRIDVEFVSNVYFVNEQRVIQCNIRDITERKLAEEALRASEEKFRSIFASMTEMVVLHELVCDEDGKPVDYQIVDCNSAFTQITGIRRDDAVGRLATDVYGSVTAPYLDEYARVAMTGEPCVFIAAYTPMDKHFYVTAASLGKNMFVTVTTDITERKRAEEEIRFQADIIENSPVIAACHDKDLNVVWVNRAYQKTTGLSLEEVRGKKCYQVWNLSKPCRGCPVITAIETGESAAHELTPDNQDHWPETQGCWLSQASPVRDEQGAVIGALEFAIDITERKRAETYREMGWEILQILNEPGDLQDSIERVIAALKTRTGVDAVGLRLQDDEDFPYLAQDGFSKNFLQTEDTLVAREKDGGVCRDKDGKACLECTCGLVISGKTDPSNPLFTKEGSSWTNNSFPLLDLPADQDPRLHPRNNCIHQGYASVALIPIRTSDRIVGLIQFNDKRKERFTLETIEILEGIAAHIGSALMLKLSAQKLVRLSAAIEQVAEGVVITDAQGTLQYVNPAFTQITGYTREEAIGKNPRILKSGMQDAEFYRRMWAALTAGEVFDCRTVNRRKDGTLYTGETTISPVKDASGQILNYVAVKRDITDHLRAEEERAELESQLNQAQKMESIGRLAGGAAHDLNNILQVVLGQSEIAMEQVGSGTPLRANLEEIQNAGRRSADLTRQLLAFARKQTIEPKVLDLNDAVADILKMLRRLIGEDIDLLWKPGAELWLVNLDPSQIDQILANLCVNARDAIGGVGKVTIETENVSIDADYCAERAEAVIGPHVMLAISDDGCGMDKETLEHVFEPFYTTKGIGEGTGLGLSTVYGIVKQNKGFVNVYSEPGKGTTFRIYLPQFAGEHSGREEAGTTEQRPGGSETVMLVEDDKSVLATTARFLEQLDYTVLTAETPSAALRLAAEHGDAIDLLITDVVMPVMSGGELAAKLTEEYPRLKCLYISGYTANVIAHRGVLEGGVHFLAKPFTRDDLARKVRELLEAD